MKKKIRNLMIAFISCMFTGIVVISVGLGAAFPVLDRISAPIVCGEGKMELESKSYSGLPGQSATTVRWLCIDSQTGEKEYISFQTAVVSGILYGLIFFILTIVYGFIPKPVKKRNEEVVSLTKIDRNAIIAIQQKMEDLRNLKKEGLITEEEYSAKKAELLQRL
jgi:hypothetical protein